MIAQRFVVTKSSNSLCMCEGAFQGVTLGMLQLQSSRPLSSAKNVGKKIQMRRPNLIDTYNSNH